MYKCNGCEDGLAKKAGAEVAFIGTVRKASDVLFTVSVYIRDVGQEKVTRQASSEIYGNTDAMWLRAVNYIVHKRLFPEGASQ
jgi:molybdopterin synthase catalytic subunit